MSYMHSVIPASNSYFEQVSEFDRKFLGRDDEPIVGKAAEEFTSEGEKHPERYDFLSKWFVNELAFSSIQEGLVMDLGSGPGFLTRMVAKSIPNNIEIVGVDLSEDMVNISNQINQDIDNISFVNGDARLIKDIAHKEINAVISRRMIHRVDNLEKFLNVVVSSLKPDGGVMLNYGFRRPTNVDELKAFLEAANLRKGHPTLYEAFVRAVLNAPTLEEYRQAGTNVAEKLNLKSFKLEVFPFDVGMIFVR
jgi:ubiquinone/menaquinone biosynthesis C-methylase UbiE